MPPEAEATLTPTPAGHRLNEECRQGTDASDAFTELHSQSIFGAFAPKYRIGRLATPSGRGHSAAESAWAGVGVSSRFWDGLAPDEPIEPAAEVLASPFPHTKFTGTGLETFRFQWAVADRLLRTDDSGTSSVPPADSRGLNHMFRQKSSLGVLNIERDWLHLSDEATYAFEMNMRRTLLLEHAELVSPTPLSSADGNECSWVEYRSTSPTRPPSPRRRRFCACPSTSCFSISRRDLR